MSTPSRGRSPRLRRAALLVAWNVGLTAILVVALELGFGGWTDPLRINQLNIPRNVRLNYDAAGLYDAESTAVVYTRDKHGFRGVDGDPSLVNLLTVGGSTTDQRYISDERTWQSVMRAEMAGRGRDWRIANAGVDGQSTLGHVKCFQLWFPKVPGLRPSHILFYIGINDLLRPLDPGSERSLVKGPQSWTDHLRERSVLWHVWRTATAVAGARRAHVFHHRKHFDALEWTLSPRQANHDFAAPRIAGYLERVALLVEHTRALGAVPVFVTQPTRYCRETPRGLEGVATLLTVDGLPVNGLDLRAILRRMDAALGEYCAAHQLAFLDIAGTPAWEDGDFYDHVHMTPSGAGKLGRLLADGMLRQLAAAENPAR